MPFQHDKARFSFSKMTHSIRTLFKKPTQDASTTSRRMYDRASSTHTALGLKLYPSMTEEEEQDIRPSTGLWAPSMTQRIKRRISTTFTSNTSATLAAMTLSPQDIMYTTPMIPDSFPDGKPLDALVAFLLVHPEHLDTGIPLRVYREKEVWCTVDNRWLYIVRNVGVTRIAVTRIKKPKEGRVQRGGRGEGKGWWRHVYVIRHSDPETGVVQEASTEVRETEETLSELVSPYRGWVQYHAWCSPERHEAEERVAFMKECQRLSLKHRYSSMSSLFTTSEDEGYTKVEREIMERTWEDET